MKAHINNIQEVMLEDGLKGIAFSGIIPYRPDDLEAMPEIKRLHLGEADIRQDG